MTNPTTQHNNCIATILQFAIAIFALIAWLGAVGCAVAAPVGESPEYAVKAAFLFKFGSYIEWPAGTFETAKTPLIIGVIGEDPFDGTLDSVVADHTIDGRPVEVVRAQQIDQIKNVHILFISLSEKARVSKITSSLEGKKVLTISEFDDPGIIIQFIIENNKVRFDINLDQANHSGIKLSSKLLSVARTVKRK